MKFKLLKFYGVILPVLIYYLHLIHHKLGEFYRQKDMKKMIGTGQLGLPIAFHFQEWIKHFNKLCILRDERNVSVKQ